MATWEYAQLIASSKGEDAVPSLSVHFGADSGAKNDAEADPLLTNIRTGVLDAANALGSLGWEMLSAVVHPIGKDLVSVYWFKRRVADL